MTEDKDILKPDTRLDWFILKIGDVLSVLFLIAVLISFFEIIMRYFFNSPTVWVHETTIAIIGMAMAYGGVYCYACDKHIAVTVVKDALPVKWQKVLAIINDGLVLIFASGGCYAMYFLASRAVLRPSGELYLQRSGSAWNSPLPAITKVFILLVFIILIMQSILHLVKKIRAFKNEE